MATIADRLEPGQTLLAVTGAAMMLVASRPQEMGRFVTGRLLRILGWAATLVMAVVVTAMLFLLIRDR
jgi:Mn2+/Fe2+ NRAMP family transporter